MLACRNPIDRIPKVFRNTPKLCAYIIIMSIIGSMISCNRYKQPEKKVHCKEESFICNGIQYTMKI